MLTYVQLFSVVILFITSLYLTISCRRVINKFSIGYFFFDYLPISLFAFITALFLGSDYFTGQGIDKSVIYHLRFGLKGAGFREYWLLILSVALGFSIAFMIPTIIKIQLNKKITSSNPAKWQNALAIALFITSLAAHPATANLIELTRFADRDDFHNYYLEPKILKSNTEKRNIIFIYAESIERTYFDESIFPGLITELRKLEKNSTHFTDIREMESTNWTIAGMTATQCGVPLFFPFDSGLTRSVKGASGFLGGATCLGDLLEKENYTLSYMGGSSLKFAAKGNFYKSHGFEEVLGKEDLVNLLDDPEYVRDWGLYDDSLFDIVFDEHEKLSRKSAETNQPFALFTLTLDTHPPFGHQSKRCSENGISYSYSSEPILNAVHCTDYLIGEFVKKIHSSQFGANTLIVIASDHLTPEVAVFDELKLGNRKNMFMIVDPLKIQPIDVSSAGSVFDIGPTLLGYLGYDAQLGLGRNLLGMQDSLVSLMPTFNDALLGWQKSVWDLWQYPTIDTDITFNLENKTALIGNQEFTYPLLIKYDDSYATTILLDLNRQKLWQDLKKLNIDDAFVWIDSCKTMEDALNSKAVLQGKICFAHGKLGNQSINISEIEPSTAISFTDIRQVAESEANDRSIYISRAYPPVHPEQKMRYDSTALVFNGWARTQTQSLSRWNDGKISDIVFLVRDGDQFDGILNLNFGTYNVQQIAVLLNGVMLGSMEKNNRNAQVSLKFDPSILKTYNSDDLDTPPFNTLRFYLPTAKKEKENGREFAIDLKSVTFL